MEGILCQRDRVAVTGNRCAIDVKEKAWLMLEHACPVREDWATVTGDHIVNVAATITRF
jgi:hypothetical protein